MGERAAALGRHAAERPTRTAPLRRLLPTLASLALLAAVLWAARYALWRGFGLYEDDYTIVPTAAGMTLGETLGFIGEYVAAMRGHARPLSDSFIYLLSNVGWRLGGLGALYFIGFALTTLNAALFWGLLRRRYGAPVALIGGLAYVLFSADTTQAYLTHSLGLQPSLTLLLLAFHLYGSRARPLAYLLAATILFAYETPYLLFLAAPLLEARWNRSLLRRAAGHALIVLALLGLAAALRMGVGEERVTGLVWREALRVSMEHTLAGPAVSLGSYGWRLVQLAAAGSGQAWLASAAAWILFVPVLCAVFKGSTGAGDESSDAKADGRRPYRSFMRLGVLGLVCLFLAYPLAFTTRATAISGRETRVHLAGVVGAPMVVAALGAAWLGWAPVGAGTRRWLASGALAVVFAGQVGFGFLVQRDYTRSWELQGSFWTLLVGLVPDADEGTAIFVDPVGLEDTLQIGANDWNLPIILEQIYDLPAEWVAPPRVYRGTPEWREYLVLPDGSFRISGDTVMAPESVFGTVDRSNVIVLHSGGGVLTRRARPLVVDEVEYTLKPPGPEVLRSLPHGFLYDLLIRPESQDPG